MSLQLIAPLPTAAPLLQTGPDGKSSDFLSSDYYQTFFAMIQRLTASPQVVTNPVTHLTGQSASIGSTQLPVGALPAGTVRVSWYAHITQAATTSSALMVTIGWTENGVALSSDGVAITGNTTTTTQSGSFTVTSDADSPLTYATTYASVGGVVMEYSLVVMVEYVSS